MVGITLAQFVPPFGVGITVEALGKPEVAGREAGISAVAERVVRIDSIAARCVHCRVQEDAHTEVVLAQGAYFALLQLDDQRPVLRRDELDDASARSGPPIADDCFDAVVAVFGNLQELLQMKPPQVRIAHNRQVARDRTAFLVQLLVEFARQPRDVGDGVRMLLRSHHTLDLLAGNLHRCGGCRDVDDELECIELRQLSRSAREVFDANFVHNDVKICY